MAAQTFDERIVNRLDRMRPSEQKAARYFQDNREAVLMESAASLAVKAKTSDATILRAAQALGFATLDELRKSLADEMRASISPAERLARTLGEVGRDLSSTFNVTLNIHLKSLEDLRRTISTVLFEKAVKSIVDAKRVMIFGLGPSSAMANYFAIQLRRFGLDAGSLTNTGLLFADDLQKLRKGDLVVILAYSHVYPELDALLTEVENCGASSILLTDTLVSKLGKLVDLVLPVARGRADMLSTHTATLGLIETLLVGVAAQRPKETLASLEGLNERRRRLTGKSMKLTVKDAQ